MRSIKTLIVAVCLVALSGCGGGGDSSSGGGAACSPASIAGQWRVTSNIAGAKIIQTIRLAAGDITLNGTRFDATDLSGVRWQGEVAMNCRSASGTLVYRGSAGTFVAIKL